ncbi:MAG: patatin-like phospholipase family protein [Helicobacteraceae bacterium]|jgi:NTE family protein|nr:patatin-like phospholipase family protein [Helicobacteraceae bacterium]
MSRSISLVLGSGGARGYAHIGAIEAFGERGYAIKSISGCSMGALVGGVYAAGNLENFKRWAINLDWIGALKLVDLSLLATGGAIKGEKVFEKIAPFFGDKRIEDLPIRFTAVATDLDGKKEFWFQEGDLKTAIRASVAIPTIFTPIYHNSRALVDGAVLNPLPIAPTMSDRTELIAAVNLCANYSTPLNLAPYALATERKKPLLARLKKLLIKLGLWNSRARANVTQLDIFQRVIEVMQDSMTLYKIAGYLPDILVEIPIDSCKTYDFHKAEEMIKLGYDLTLCAIDKYEARGENKVIAP